MLRVSKCVLSGRECPKTNNPDAKYYCPAWSEGVIWTNTQTGEEKVLHCSIQALMPAMVEVIKASNRPAAAVESMRNELSARMQRGFGALGQVMQVAAHRLIDPPARCRDMPGVQAITHESEG